MSLLSILKLGLQMFAINRTVDDGGTHNLDGATNNLSAEMKTFYDMTLLDEAQANLVHDQFGQKRPIPKNGGKTIEFRKFAPLAKALTPLTEGVTPIGDTLDVSAITATVSQYGNYIVQSDVLELTALDNTILEATKMLGRQAGLTLDTVTRNVLNSETLARFAPKWSGSTEIAVALRADLDATAVLKVDTVNQVVASMRAKNAPTINGDYICIIHPYVAYDLMTDPMWQEAHKYCRPENMYNGEIGKIGGVRFIESSEAKIFGPEVISDGLNKLVVQTAASSAATTIYVEGVLTAQASCEIACYVDGVENTIEAITPDSTNNKTALSLHTGLSANVAKGAFVYGKGGTKNGLAVFSSIFLAEGAYGVTEVTGGGLRTIVKQLGYGEDPLDQRSSIGWKAIKTAEILIPDYIVRVESCSTRFSASAQAN